MNNCLLFCVKDTLIFINTKGSAMKNKIIYLEILDFIKNYVINQATHAAPNPHNAYSYYEYQCEIIPNTFSA